MQWYPWGDEAIKAARTQDKPIFLSVGYATCYWCHVMERESFENQDVAAMLNEHFIPVKVDREERPDVDDVYMTAVQVMTNQGGWPMSVFIEPVTMQPFFGGTYFPVTDHGGRPGFMTLMEAIHDAWTDPEKRPQLEAGAERLATEVERRLADVPPPAMPGQEQIDAAVAQIMASYDEVDGGYGGAPKFPMPSFLTLLGAAAWDRDDVRESITHTLDRMAMGGMYDQVGGGFHRYSTDAQWLVPHFEKMLYDNGQLASVYARIGTRAASGFHKAIASEIADHIRRDMTDDSGAFFSAMDAEANAREGETYIWTITQVEDVLREAGMDDDTITFAKSSLGVTGVANFRDPHHPQDPKWVMHLPEHPSNLAESAGLSGRQFHQRLLPILAALKAHRDTRDQPFTDDKVLAGWNGLMIGGLADTGRLLDRPEDIAAATAAAEAIHTHMWSAQDGLLRTMRKGEARVPAYLEDHALLAAGLLKLHEATQDEQWFDWARVLVQQARDRFWTEQGWFDMPEGDAHLFVRGRSLFDGAMPSGTSAMFDVLVSLAERDPDGPWLAQARDTALSVGTVLQRSPRSMPLALAALQRLLLLDPPPTLVANLEPFTAGAVKASIDALPASLEPGAVASATLTLEIHPKWHLTVPGGVDDFALPVTVVAGGPGYTVEATLPQGRAYTGAAGTMMVIADTVHIPLLIRATGDAPVTPVVDLTFQACDDTVCQPPASHRFGAGE